MNQADLATVPDALLSNYFFNSYPVRHAGDERSECVAGERENGCSKLRNAVASHRLFSISQRGNLFCMLVGQFEETNMSPSILFEIFIASMLHCGELICLKLCGTMFRNRISGF